MSSVAVGTGAPAFALVAACLGLTARSVLALVAGTSAVAVAAPFLVLRADGGGAGRE